MGKSMASTHRSSPPHQYSDFCLDNALPELIMYILCTMRHRASVTWFTLSRRFGSYGPKLPPDQGKPSPYPITHSLGIRPFALTYSSLSNKVRFRHCSDGSFHRFIALSGHEGHRHVGQSVERSTVVGTSPGSCL